ncbi:MAG: TiaS agmantine-binding domain-containing protein [Candidatus Natronoplasma sp.]
MFIAVDDTDSRKGMCTTFLATELVKEFADSQLLDHPRLVRLNPNVPWKTRGNGAVIITLGKGEEKKARLGRIDEDIYRFDGTNTEVDQEEIFERAKRVVERWAEIDQEGTNPGLIVAKERPPEKFYHKAVKDIVELDEVREYLKEGDHLHEGFGKGRGLIGAAAALSWMPDDFTYELLTYREKSMWGEPRDVPEKDVIEVDKRLKNTFDSYDHEENKQAIAPSSPCPVLYGIRGEDPEALKDALGFIGGERPERWMLFLTNQGTDDHIQEMKISETEPWTSARVKGKVCSEPRTIEGGHVLFDLEDGTSEITSAAYEPTKGFRDTVKELIPGDEVELWGGIRKEPKTLNIEKMRIIRLEDKIVKVRNPECPECGKRMSSMGTNAGYRCKRCRTKADEDQAVRKKVERELEEGWYEVPVSARRHLSKPLIRDNISRSTSRRSS